MLFYIETLGCQMNKLDSELVTGLLKNADYQSTSNPCDADVAILNTCSVREHAEQKALSRIGYFEYLRKKNSKPALIAMIGCFAQRSPEFILKKAPFLDILCGPNEIHRLIDLIRECQKNVNILCHCEHSEAISSVHTQKSSSLLRRTNGIFDFTPRNDRKEGIPKRLQKNNPVQAVTDFRKSRGEKNKDDAELESLDLHRPVTDSQFHRFVRVQRGCDKFCSYCVVPYVRGPEMSRPVENIIQEVKRIDQTGCKEITLIGQTISSYRYTSHGVSVNLPELLRLVHDACSIARIRFITSYPADFSIDIFHAMRELSRICPYLHLPAQHGSNRMLSLMNRKYTIEKYMEILDQGKNLVPALSVSGDFIVGFPTETDHDHNQSVKLLEKVRYKNCFIFKYSVRPGTLAEKKFTDDIPEKIKSLRHAWLLEVQDSISSQDNQASLGKTVDVLVEGVSKKNKSKEKTINQLVGRTVEDKIVIFQGPIELTGQIEKVKITRATSLTLFGEK